MSHLENFNHSEKEKNLIRVDQDRRHKNIDLVLHFQTHNTYNFYYVYYLSGILSDEKKSGLRFVCGRNNKNMMDAGVETGGRNINKPGWWHCSRAGTRMCPRYSHHYECGTRSGGLFPRLMIYILSTWDSWHRHRYVQHVKIWRKVD